MCSKLLKKRDLLSPNLYFIAFFRLKNESRLVTDHSNLIGCFKNHFPIEVIITGGDSSK